MCARKGFDAVELDDIDSFDPPATTGFYLTAGDAQNYLAFAFNLIHAYGMTALWKNNPALVALGRQVCGRRGRRGVLRLPRVRQLARVHVGQDALPAHRQVGR